MYTAKHNSVKGLRETWQSESDVSTAQYMKSPDLRVAVVMYESGSKYTRT